MHLFVRRSVAASTAAATVLTTFLLGLPPGAQAQVSEIVVTTRKREESIQDVPIAVTAISTEQIERQGISDLADVAKLSTSLQFDTAFGSQDTRITVRGLSNTRGRSNVAFLVDGIDVTTENVISAGSGLLTNRRLLTDVERIEVVKGPQSALYGRAAFAGAISYVTKEPGDDFEGRVSADVADYGQREFGAAFGGPVFGDLLGIRVTGVHWTQDGFYQNSISGENVGSGEGYGTSLTAVFRPLDDMKWKARVAFSEEESAPRASVRLEPDSFLLYPPEAIAAGIGAGSGPVIGLFDHGPGFALPSTYGDASGKQVRLSENFRTGEDYPGDDIRVLQTSLVGSWDLGVVDLSSYTGYTDADLSQFYDQDYQARGRPDTLLAHQESNTDQTTRQFSQELRLQTALDGPVQFTFGALYWEEERDLYDNNFIIACLPVIASGEGDSRNLIPAPFFCNGTGGTVATWQEYARQLGPRDFTLANFPELANYPGDLWSADTKSWSYYAMVEWQVLDSLKLTVENRLVVEEFDLQKPNQSGCTTLGFAFSFLASETADPNFDALCESVNTIVKGYDPDDTSQTRDFAYIRGTVSSRFHTPKVTLDWQIDDQRLAYFSWAKAQKPGGINQLSPGGTPVVIDDEYFKPEKMTAWELGLKTSWEAAGSLVVNTAAFFQDYTDKQVSTQIVTELGLQPRVVNASAAEVWGVEIEALWQPEFVDGLSLSVGYTWLDAEYSDFPQDTRSLARIAAAGRCEEVELDGVKFCHLEYGGHKLERTPENALVAAASLRRPLADTGFDWLAEVSANYQDERFVDDDNFLKFEDYWLVDLRLGLTSDRTEFLLYVDNAFDDDTVKSGGSGPDFGEQVTQLGFTAGLGVPHWFGTLPDPRVFGMRLNYRFGTP